MKSILSQTFVIMRVGQVRIPLILGQEVKITMKNSIIFNLNHPILQNPHLSEYRDEIHFDTSVRNNDSSAHPNTFRLRKGSEITRGENKREKTKNSKVLWTKEVERAQRTNASISDPMTSPFPFLPIDGAHGENPREYHERNCHPGSLLTKRKTRIKGGKKPRYI